MCGFQSAANLEHDASRLLRCELASFEQNGTQVLPFHKIHGDELESVSLSEIKNANDIFMRDLTGENQLLFEAAKDFRIFREFWADELDRYNAVEFRVVRLIYCAHAALAKQGNDLVTISQNGTRFKILPCGRYFRFLRAYRFRPRFGRVIECFRRIDSGQRCMALSTARGGA